MIWLLAPGCMLASMGDEAVMVMDSGMPAAREGAKSKRTGRGLGRGGLGMGGGGAAVDDGVFEAENRAGVAPPAAGLAAKPESAWKKDAEEKPGEPATEASSEETARTWFPEAFLWAPMVETSEDGVASLDITVPDSLTTWRVLGLAHARNGQQAGTVHTFDSTLPQYVEPVVPGWLVAGDQLSMPVRVVNNSDRALSSTLSVRGDKTLDGEAAVAMNLGPWGSQLVDVDLRTFGAGEGEIRALLGDTDAVVRAIPVRPGGKRISKATGGTLSGPRTLKIPSPDQADPATQRLVVHVYPGPLSVLQTELDRLQRASTVPWSGTYGFALSQSLAELSKTTGVALSPGVLRRLRLTSWQRLVRESVAPSPGQAADLLVGLNAVSDHELAASLHDRLVRLLVNGQRADGSFSRTSNATLQQVIVQTAFAARVLPEKEVGPRLRASGALERLQSRIDDSYTAAVVLASGLVPASNREALEQIVIDGLEVREDGQRTPEMGSEKNPWGRSPTLAERRAWTALALASREDLAWRGDFAAQLLQDYHSTWGFGAGPADPIALEAVVRTLPALTAPAEVVLSLDGVEADRITVDPLAPEAASLTALPGAREPEITLRATAPGLAFRATLDSWVPFDPNARLEGVDVEVTATPMSLGSTSTITLSITAPSNVPLVIEQGIPAGADVVLASGSGLEGRPGMVVTPLTDRVRISLESVSAGEVVEVPLAVTPAFSGTFQTTALHLEAGGRAVDLPPLVWEVAP